MSLLYIFNTILVLNALWFGAGFWYFGIKSRQAAKLIIKKKNRSKPSFDILAYSLKFLGGLNLAFAILSTAVLSQPAIFSTTLQQAVFAGIFGFAHGTQFYLNLPIAIREYNHQPHVWPVLKGKMYFIFLVDATLCVLNLVFLFLAAQ